MISCYSNQEWDGVRRTLAIDRGQWVDYALARQQLLNESAVTAPIEAALGQITSGEADPCGKAGTWIEVKLIKGRPYWYERTRVYLGAGKSRIKSKYLGPGPERTPESAAAQLHQWAKAHGQNQPSSNDGATNNSKSPPRAAAGGGKNKGPQPEISA